MSPERYRQIRNLFEAVVERPAEARGAFLAAACADDEELRAEIEGLLAAHARHTDLPAQPAVPAWNPQRLEGRRIGPYEILREIGHGGMGTVYLAARADRTFRKQVAVKVVRAEAGSEEVLRRFQQEREILATLDHPNIARLLDGGSTAEGLPYFVMEYVAGEPIDIWCDRHKLNVAQRLELFRGVCAAVEYAHRHGFVHRDLKPGNILVTAEGQPKLLDFGIAKILRAPEDQTVYVTRSGLHLMTPEYASPEQVRGEAITTLSDVYSLGIILYELLTGHRPYRMRSRVLHEIVRVICEEPPTRPSTAVALPDKATQGPDQRPITVTPDMISRARNASPAELRRQLSGDLDNILLKSLGKEPLARYRSAEQFSEDIERHLSQQPVLARGDTLGYRAGKFLQRHPVWVLMAVALAAGLVTGAITVRLAGAAYVAGTLAVLGLWYAATDKNIGKRIAEGLFQAPSRIVLLRTGIIFGFLLFFSFVYGPWRESVLFLLMALCMAFVTIRVTIRVAVWLARQRWAGRLLLDLSRPRSRGTRGGLLANGLLLVILSVDFYRSGKPDLDAGLGLLIIFQIAGWFLDGRLEVRDQGIVHEGKLLRWGNIESYEWTSEEREIHFGLLHRRAVYFPVLHLNLRRLLKALPPAKIAVPPEKRETLETLLSRYLSAWPAEADRQQ
jgi:serine/threonine protein kinase